MDAGVSPRACEVCILGQQGPYTEWQRKQRKVGKEGKEGVTGAQKSAATPRLFYDWLRLLSQTSPTTCSCPAFINPPPRPMPPSLLSFLNSFLAFLLAHLPRFSSFLSIMTFEAELQKVDKVRICLTTNPELATVQAVSLIKIIDLVREGEMERRTYCQATRSRRKGVRTLLLTIYQRLGVEVLFLCSIVLSITKLSEIKKDDINFISKLGYWRRTAQIARSICNLAKQHFTSYYDVLSQPGTVSSIAPQDSCLFDV